MLSEQRKRIDDIDKQLVALFEERMTIAKNIAIIKKEASLPILDEKREQAVLQKVCCYAKNDALKQPLKQIYMQLMQLSKDYQQQWIEK